MTEEKRNKALDQAEIDLLIAKRAREEVETDKARLEYARLKKVSDLEALGDFEHRVQPFWASVDTGTVRGALDTVRAWFRQDPTAPCTIELNSPGGSVFAGLALVDAIRGMRKSGLVVNTHSIGYAASMGGILLQAGETRSMGKHAYLMIHEISSVGIGKTSELEDEVKLIKRLQVQILDILAERSTMTPKEIAKEWKRKDWWLDADDALRLGFIDEIR